MQDTDRVLREAERAWLLARGWMALRIDAQNRPRYSHHAAAASLDCLASDAIALTRAEPLRFVGGRRG
jgi:ABC-type cobalamin transport system ATPase subunit